MANELLSQGVNLMWLGMGVVFIFLALLVVFTSLMSTVIQRYFPETAIVLPSKISPSPAPALPDARIRAAIKAAIAEHRKKNSL